MILIIQTKDEEITVEDVISFAGVSSKLIVEKRLCTEHYIEVEKVTVDYEMR